MVGDLLLGPARRPRRIEGRLNRRTTRRLSRSLGGWTAFALLGLFSHNLKWKKKIDGKDQNNSILEIQAVAKGYTFHGDKINKTNE
jgi:hypothetical protein